MFVDSGIFVAFASEKDSNHARSLELVDEIRKWKFGRVNK